MTIYNYKCKNNHEYSEMRSIKEDQKITQCQECNEPLKQVYYVPLVQLKGSGFYRNTK
jgi:putative FmdB family regulatory protein